MLRRVIWQNVAHVSEVFPASIFIALMMKTVRIYNDGWVLPDYTAKHPRRREVSGYHGGEYEDDSFLGYSAV
jgi:hypothetical protein